MCELAAQLSFFGAAFDSGRLLDDSDGTYRLFCLGWLDRLKTQHETAGRITGGG